MEQRRAAWRPPRPSTAIELWRPPSAPGTSGQPAAVPAPVESAPAPRLPAVPPQPEPVPVPRISEPEPGPESVPARRPRRRPAPAVPSAGRSRWRWTRTRARRTWWTAWRVTVQAAGRDAGVWADVWWRSRRWRRARRVWWRWRRAWWATRAEARIERR